MFDDEKPILENPNDCLACEVFWITSQSYCYECRLAMAEVSCEDCGDSGDCSECFGPTEGLL